MEYYACACKSRINSGKFLRRSYIFMEKTSCVELCSDCPLRTMFPEAAVSPESQAHLKKVGEEAVPQVEYAHDRSSASISIDYATGPKKAEIAILPEGSETGPAFWVREETWRRGAVHRAFEDCSQPGEERYGFLKLRKQIVCEALRSIK